MYTSAYTLCIIISSCAWMAQGGIVSGPTPPGLLKCYQQRSNGTSSSGPPMASEAECIRLRMWESRVNETIPDSSDDATKDWLRSLMDRVTERGSAGRKRRMTPRVRREYRMLSDPERTKYHNAIINLKSSFRYDALANLHKPNMNPMAHGGPAFFPWHRIYLLMYEEALIDMDPDVVLPYWASNLDNALPDPRTSSLWTDDFVGNGNGAVINGPFALMNTPFGQLARNYGAGVLITNADIQNIMSIPVPNLSQISKPTAPSSTDLEGIHGKVHMWVDGHMGDLPSASFDPLFFMHHAFIDCIYEQYREKQRLYGIDPTTHYPALPAWNPHHGFGPINLYPISIIEALSDNYGLHIYECAPIPSCSERAPWCESEHLRCNRETYVCEPHSENIPCTNNCAPHQNQYCTKGDGYCDSRLWAYLPVQVMSYRPPETYKPPTCPVRRHKYTMEYPVYGTDEGSDVQEYLEVMQYAPGLYCPLNSPSSPCAAADGYVTYKSYGLNYNGYFTDYTKTDSRYAISSSMGYVGIQNPKYGNGRSDVIIRAYDACGRLCRPLCRVGSRYEPCSGIVTVYGRSGSDYGKSYDDAVGEVYNIDDEGSYPTYEPTNTYLAFNCDHSGNWPLYQQDYDTDTYDTLDAIYKG